MVVMENGTVKNKYPRAMKFSLFSQVKVAIRLSTPPVRKPEKQVLT